ncbi:peroxiredoxin [Sinomonas humi]|uniref:Alkyl hydroperoxide reductase E n=1 Tax=Sinomonas humi TaxID=1338436 RepID=A0A0B2AF17_9MICC|nr:peroxiredoxin [Sinomonas humi]KHL00448.1 peroxiredoxin [Sinomonas humi]
MTSPQGEAAGLEIGSAAPDFELPNQFGEPVRLSSLQGSPVVIVFYPFAFSRICTGELAEIRDRWDVFAASGARVLAVSVDSKFALRAFAEAERYDFPLLADFWPHGEVAKRYGIFDESSGMARRGTFILDREGIVRFRVINPAGEARDLGLYSSALAEIG